MDAEPSPDLYRKQAGSRVQRHQSLYVSSSHTDDVNTDTTNSSLLPVLHQMLKMLADKRVKGGRPEEIGVSYRTLFIIRRLYNMLKT